MPNIINDVKLDFKDVLLRPKRSTLRSRADVDLYREIKFRNSKQTYKGIPVMASNMDTVGTFEMAIALAKHGLFTTIHKYYSIEEWKEFASKNPDCLNYVAASSGTGQGDFDRLSQILSGIPEITFICLDVANGYSQHFVEYVRKVRAAFPTHTIIAGNVVTGEMVEELILSGADIIKVGIGPGSVCTTRMKTGVGFPQLSAVIECADAAHGLQGHIISDGGCTCPGDVAKAFGAGADFVMIGGMLAGHDQCAGDVIVKNGRKFKLFYGMSSATAMEKHAGGVAEYRNYSCCSRLYVTSRKLISYGTHASVHIPYFVSPAITDVSVSLVARRDSTIILVFGNGNGQLFFQDSQVTSILIV